MKTLKQIVKEFWLPFLLSVLWVFYNIFGDKIENVHGDKVKNIVNIFGPTFFLLSWLTGQFFRIKKQTKVEDNFLTVESRLQELLSEIERQTTKMIAHISGGDSFCYLSIFPDFQNKNIVKIMIFHKG